MTNTDISPLMVEFLTRAGRDINSYRRSRRIASRLAMSHTSPMTYASKTIEIQSADADAQVIQFSTDRGTITQEVIDADGTSIVVEMNIAEAKRLLAELAVTIAMAEMNKNN